MAAFINVVLLALHRYKQGPRFEVGTELENFISAGYWSPSFTYPKMGR